MHPLTRFFNHLKRTNVALALAREHIDDRGLTEWYPEWMYELMETDEVRNRAYRGAIQEKVSGKTVLELGTGRKALWAIFCSKVGAKKVYAVEANRKAYEASLQLVRSQGIGNVHLIHGFSDKIELPERCEVLVHDLVGDIGSSEGMIPFIADAKRRLLAPGAIHIPQRCETLVVPVEEPRLRPKEWALSFALRGFSSYEPLRFVRGFGFPHSAALLKPQAFEDFVFDRDLPLGGSQQLVFEIERDGALRGACFFIRLHLSDAHVVDTWKGQTSWSTPYVRLVANTPVRKGDLVEMTVRSDLSANPSYSLKLVLRSGASAREIGDYAWSGD